LSEFYLLLTLTFIIFFNETSLSNQSQSLFECVFLQQQKGEQMKTNSSHYIADTNVLLQSCSQYLESEIFPLCLNILHIKKCILFYVMHHFLV